MLMPFILKEGLFYFYEEFVIEKNFRDKLESVALFYKEHSDKKFFIPEKLYYEHENFLLYNDSDKVFFMDFVLASRSKMDPYDLFLEVIDLIMMGNNVKDTLEYLNERVVTKIKLNSEVGQSLNDLVNNTRIFTNRGYTHNELAGKSYDIDLNKFIPKKK
jgi:CRISPR/Cas system CMR subunit Cmr4 (Cas7 group RAMP superfamily)